MSIAEKLTQIAKNQQRVYEAGYAKGQAEGGYDEGFTDGKKAEYDAFWDAHLNNGDFPKNNQALFAGNGWNDATFYPKYDLKFPKNRGDYIFFLNDVSNIKQRLIECGVTMDTSQITIFTQTFTYAVTEELPEISAINATSLSQTFANCGNLKTIDKLILKADGSQTFYNTFDNTPNLENISIEGVIGQNGFNVQWSTKLSMESIENIMFALSDTTTGKSITLSKVAVDKAYETSEGANDGSTSPNSFFAGWGTSWKWNWTISLI